MGYGKWAPKSYASYSATANLMSRGDLYHRRSKSDLTRSGEKVNVEQISFRESRDSEEHLLSTPIIVGLDVTGSMGSIPESLTKGGLGRFVEQTLERQPVTDPHICFLGIGDAVYGDKAPLQATQFESDNRICEQLTDIWLEGGGGGNHFESYDLAWAFAAYKTKTDAWDKRQEKGYLFTVGDEKFPESSSQKYMKLVFGDDCPESPTPESLLEEVEQRYRTFHVIIEEGLYATRHGGVTPTWKERFLKRALPLDNYHHLPELLVSTMAIDKGTSLEEVLEWWNNDGVVESLKHAFA